ncbi:MAG: DNA-directed RNA polymerase subunit omega [Oscillospiraceae bacterium]|nr:DNA-directed RNA polymerase subunit omega [Oscillospiraceae bacterium]
MLYPSLASLLKQINSRYLLVNIIARRARDITLTDKGFDEYRCEKPVSRAIDEIAAGELMVTLPDDL